MTDDQKLDGPLDHILRPEPPWRVARLTECGRPAGDVKSLVTRHDVEAKIKRLGRQRAAFSTCMTCATRSRERDWLADPVGIMRRDTGSRTWGGGPAGHAEEVRLDLVALTALFEAHRDEFYAIRGSIAEGTDLERARKRRPRRATR